MPDLTHLLLEAGAALPEWALSKPMIGVWYALSRLGDHGRLPPFRRLMRLTDQLWLGGQINAAGWQRLQKWQIGALVNLRVEWDDRQSGIHTPHYLWLPTVDGTPPTQEQLQRGVEFIHEQISAGRGVYVHCAGGLGRAPTLAICYLVARGLPADEAIRFVSVRRPFIHLSARQQAAIHTFAESQQNPALPKAPEP
ncbi:MAG: protein phosphatase [Chloroflexi bacterium CFX4]|nr:protein phosphatase [Chloroflexi bacterium CFX4]MDL1922623.1 protein phosphatase [Chloroflexi bacterium CFX3]